MYDMISCRQWNTTRTLLITAALGLLLAHGAAAQYADGAGVEGNPYAIATVQDLLNLSNPDNSADWDKHFRMTNDIDMDKRHGRRLEVRLRQVCCSFEKS